MLEHILIPLDFSDLAKKALPYAKHIVAPDGKITLLTVIEAEPDAQFMARVSLGVPITQNVNLPDYSAQAEDYLKQVADQLRTTHLAVDISVQEGSAADTIVDVAENLGVDAIVMSTHGRTGITRWVLGSVTQKVVTGAPCPVFVIPSSA